MDLPDFGQAASDVTAAQRRIGEVPARERRFVLRCRHEGHEPVLIAVVARDAVITRWGPDQPYPPAGQQPYMASCEGCGSEWWIDAAKLRHAVDHRGSKMGQGWVEDFAQRGRG